MSRTVALALVSLSLLFLIFPLAIGGPGLPAGLKSDEPAYFLMALSLARDGDLRVETEDLERAFQEFPYRPVNNLILMTDDGWRTVLYGKPYLYSLFAAPFAAVAGAHGMIFFNSLLLLAMIWMGALYLARYNPPGIAALFAAGFFLVSPAFAYVFWLHPEVFSMTAVAACLFLGLRPRGPGERWRRTLLLAALSGAVLALAVYHKPVIGAVGLAPLYGFFRGRRWAEGAAWLAGAALSLGAAVGLAVALTGHPTPYLGVERQGTRVCDPETIPVTAATAATAIEGLARPTGGAWSWIFEMPEVDPGMLLENGAYFLIGRHTGILPYFPFAILALGLFLAHRPRAPDRWVLLAALGAVALFFLIYIPANWQGGGGFVGNRYFVNLYPAFLFLATRIAPAWLTAVGYAAGGLFLGGILFTPFGAPVSEPTLQAHVRGAPFGLLPLELTLREVPGYQEIDLDGLSILARRDNALARGESVWVQGGSEVELLLLASEPLPEPLYLQVRSAAPGNRVRIRVGAADETLTLGPGTPAGPVAQVRLAPGGPTRRSHRPGHEIVVYRFAIETDAGRVEPYTRSFPPPTCPDSGFAFYDTLPDNFYLGAEIALLSVGGPPEREVFGIEWRKVQVRSRVPAGQRFFADVELANTSAVAWDGVGAARVRMAYHWLDETGTVVVQDGRRTEIGEPLPAGRATRVLVEIDAPEAPGRYVLELDPLLERVAWFSDRGAAPYRVEVTVVPAAEVPEAAEAAPATPAADAADAAQAPDAADTPGAPEADGGG